MHYSLRIGLGIGIGLADTDAKTEEGVVVDDGVVGTERAEGVGEPDYGFTVVGAAPEQSEIARGVAYVDVHRDEKLRRAQRFPYAHVDDAIIAYEPAERHIDAFESRGAPY